MWNLTNNLTNSRYIHRERLSLFFLFPFHTDTVKSITSKLFWFCFSFSFLLPSIILKFPHLWKRKMKQSHVCVTLQALERLSKFQQQPAAETFENAKKNCLCGQRCCSAFILLSSVSKKYLTLLKLQSNQTLVFQRFTRIPFEKLCSVRQKTMFRKKTLMVADAGYLHLSPNTKEHQ